MTTKHTPKHIIKAVCDYFCIDAERLRNMKRPNYWDHEEGYGRASHISQALCAALCGKPVKALEKDLNRTESCIRKAKERVDRDCRADPVMRADITNILKAL